MCGGIMKPIISWVNTLSVLVKMPPHIKRLVSLSYLASTTWPCINEAETVPICPALPADEMQATAPGHAAPRWCALLRGIVGLSVGEFLFTHTFVALRCVTSCQESSFLTNRPGYPFPNLARPALCHVSAPPNGQGNWLLICSDHTIPLTAPRR